MRRLLCYAALPEAGRLLQRDGEFLCVGVGMASSAARVARALATRRYDEVFLFGVGGTWPQRLREAGQAPLDVGALAVIGSDRFGDLGVETPSGFESLGELSLGRSGAFEMDEAASALLARELNCPVVPGVTVARGSGTDACAQAVQSRTAAVIESMEGAAVALACHEAGVPMVQLRAVSNFVGDRERGAWSLDSACAALQDAVEAVLDLDRTR